MKQIEKLSLPTIPEHLVDSLEQISNLDQYMHGGVNCVLKQPNQHLLQWLNEVFKRPIHVTYVISGHPLLLGMPPHKDLSGRMYGYHYVLQTGGKSVFTTIYDDDLNVAQQEILKPNTWYKLPTNEWHSVHGIEPGQSRLSITVTCVDDYPVDNPDGTKPSDKGGYYKGIDAKQWVSEQNSKVY